MVEKLNKEFSVPLKWMLGLATISTTAVGLSFSVGIWVSKMDTKVQAAELSIQESKDRNKKVFEYIMSVDRRLANIEGRLGIRYDTNK
jgi:hypothetical protein